MLIQKSYQWLFFAVITVFTGLFVVSCSSGPAALESAGSEATDIQVQEEDAHAHETGSGAEMLVLPDLQAAELGGEKLQVVATTSIIGDVVAQVGGDTIELTTLMAAGQDPHSYEPAARELTAVATADAVFVNGWNLEEGLASTLENIAGDALIVPISADIEPLSFGAEEDDHDHEADPHVWFNVQNVEQWVENVEHVLSKLDPANSDVYANRAAAYLADLDELQVYAEEALAEIPEEKRSLVTNHDSFGYLADAYGFEVLGTVIPAASTLAEPSASDLAGLTAKMEARGVCTIFTETAVSDTLAHTVANELDGCDDVRVLQLYTGSVGPVGSGADSFITMFRANIDTIVAGLK